MSTSVPVKKFYPPPEWLTEEYVQQMLRNYFKDDKLLLVNLEKIPASPIGENFVSIITRIKAEYYDAQKTKHAATYLIKTTYTDKDPSAEFFSHYGVYTREMNMYEFVLPQLTQILREHGDMEKLHAETIYVNRAHGSIIFEDLSLSDYVIVDRIERLDMSHAKLALRKLAKFHAAAAVLSERQPDIFAHDYDCGFFNRRTDVYKVVMQNMLDALLRYLVQVPALKEKYHHKIAGLQANIMEYGARVSDVNPAHFMTLAHGDYWTTNILFKFDGAHKPIDVVPIDYQFSVWGSPAIDLHYFFNTSLREELRLHKQLELQQFYYYALVAALKLFKYGGHVPSLFEFNLQVQARSFYAVFAALLFQPVMVYNGAEEASFQNILLQTVAAKRYRDSIFENEVVQKYLLQVLPVLDQKGLLDRMD